jgi:hypothetical protein
MAPTGIETRPTALDGHREAIRAFAVLTECNLEATCRAFADFNPGRPDPKAAGAHLAIANLLATGSDLYMALPPQTEAAASSEYEAWQTINHSSFGTAEQDASAKLRWRRARLAGYLAFLNGPRQPATAHPQARPARRRAA